MNHYTPYPAYKKSNIEWIGKIPTHWKIGKLKHLGTLKGGAGFPTNLQGRSGHELPFYKVGDLSKSSDAFLLGETTNTLSRSDALSLGATVFPKGTIAWAKIGAALFLNRRRIINRPSCLDNNMTGFIVDNNTVTIKFAFFLMCGLDFAFYAKPGAVPSLSEGEQSSIPIAIPPYDETCDIVKKIEQEIKSIDDLILKKGHFIELLKEKRQALTTSAVTKGINSNVKMKDSDVPWIDQVPEHWNQFRIATLFKEVSRSGRSDLPVLSISIHDGITDKELNPEDKDRQTYQIEDRTKYKRVLPNDIAYNTMRAWQGAFGAVKVEGLVSPAYVVAQPRRALRTSYVESLLRTPMAIEEMRRFSRGIADFRMRLYWEYFRDIRVCIPPLDEQDEIIAYIDRETLRIDSLIKKTQQSIDLLKERRSAFITAAVTGQIDLRGE